MNKSVYAAKDIDRIELRLNPHSDHEALRKCHEIACEKEPGALRLRDASAFEYNPDHALIQVWLKASREPITAGMAVLFDEDITTVELGSLYVAPVFRGFGLGQLLVDSLVTKFNDDNHLAQYADIRMIARVRYGNYGPIPILNKSNFSVEKIADHKVHWVYDPKAAHRTACRLYDKITATGVIIEDDLYNAMCSVHGSVRGV